MSAPVAEIQTRHSPYQGLVPYSEADAEWFFGRDEWSEVVADNFRAYRITVLYGASGVGKSSLLRAGLLRRLSEEAHANVAADGAPRLLPVTFSAWSLDEPLAGLEDAVHGAAARLGVAAPTPEGPLATVLAAWAAAVDCQLLVVLDQLEELFAYHEGRDDGVLEQISAALGQRNPAVHFLLSIREDALANLDGFEGHVSGLGEHLLRLEHLDRRAAREAILQPLERWNRLIAAPDEEVEIEPMLIDAVLEQVSAGRVRVGANGSTARGERAGVEAPYLQLVLTRLWDEERRSGSRLLRLETLARLGGADRIVRTHLDAALAALPESDRDIAGRTLRYLVTPSGTKIAHRVSDLADYTQAPAAEIEYLVDRLAGEMRVLRPAGDGRYEIYHDMLAGPILDWRRRWEERQQRARERRRLGILAGIAAGLATIAVTVAVLAVFAWQARQDARRGQSEALAGDAIATLDTDAPRALTRAVQAAEAASTSRAEDALRVTLANYFLRKTFRGHDGFLRAAAFGPRSRLVTGSDDGTARLWDTDSGRTVRIFGAPGSSAVTSADVSADGKLVATGDDDGAVRIWNAGDGTLSKRLKRHEGTVFDVAFDSRGNRLVTASYDGTARIWDVATGRLLEDIEAGDPVFAAAFNPDGTIVATASGYDGETFLWHADTGKRLPFTLRGHHNNVEDVVFSSDGRRIATAGSDGTARIWETATGNLAHVLRGHEGSVFAAAFSGDDRLLLTAGSDGTARLWDTGSGDLVHVLGSSGSLFAGDFSPDGNTIVTAGDDGAARLWNVEDIRPLHTLETRGGAVEGVAFSGDGKTVVTAGDGAIWNARTGRRLHTLGADALRHAVFSPDGTTIMTADDDGNARLWHVKTGALAHVLRGHRGPVLAVAFSPDGRLVATGGEDRSARIWDARTGRELHTLRPHYGPVYAVAFSPDGKLVATAGGDASMRVWSAGGGQLLRSLDGRSTLRSVAFSPDNEMIAAASDVDAAWLWSVADGSTLHRLGGHAGIVWTVAFSPDGSRLVTSSDDELARIWDTANGHRLQALTGHAQQVRGAKFSPDGKLVVTVSNDATARLWDTESGRQLATLHHDDAVSDAAFSPDGKLVVTASQDGTARIWRCDLCGLGIDELLARAKERLAASS